MPDLVVEGLSAGYGRLQVLFDVSLRAPDRKVTVVVGPNGSGKSTLLKTVFGLTTVYRGKIVCGGVDITGRAPHAIARLGVAYVPQTENIFAELTVKENLVMATYGMDSSTAEERVREVLEMFPVLKQKLRCKAKTLSGGERQMLATALALIRRPKLMMFDEPTAGLAPKIALELLETIASLKDMGITVVLVEQNAKKALEYGDKGVLMVGGRVVFEGDASELLGHPKLARMYLGLA